MLGSQRFVGQAHWFVLAAALLLASCNGQDGISSSSTPASSSQLPSASTGNATLSWSAPSENTNGSALTDLGGFKISYGTEPTQLTNWIALTNPGLLTYVLTELPIGTTYYFTVSAVTTAGVESAPSHTVSTTIS
jgi:ABC-type oligopeptide transport system substrate-binding subunit